MLKCFAPAGGTCAYVKTRLKFVLNVRWEPEVFPLRSLQEHSCAPVVRVPKPNVLVKIQLVLIHFYAHLILKVSFTAVFSDSLFQILFLHFRNRCSLIRTSWTLAWNLNFWAGHQAPAFSEPSTTPMTWPGPRLSSPQPVSTENWNLLHVACLLF